MFMSLIRPCDSNSFERRVPCSTFLFKELHISQSFINLLQLSYGQTGRLEGQKGIAYAHYDGHECMGIKIKGLNTSRNNDNTKVLLPFQLHRDIRSRKWSFRNWECKYVTILLHKCSRNLLKKAVYQLKALTSGIFNHTTKMVEKDDVLAIINSANMGVQN